MTSSPTSIVSVCCQPYMQSAIADNVYGWQQTDTVEVDDDVIY